MYFRFNHDTNVRFWIVVIFVKLIIVFSTFSVEIFNDSYSYYYPFSIFNGQLHPFRMVVYPELVSFFAQINLDKSPSYLITLQHCLSFVSIVFFYRNIRYLTQYKPLVYFSTILYVLWKDVYQYDNLILAESISVLFINIFVYFILKNERTHNNNNLVYILFIGLFCVLLKPALIFVLFVASAYAIFRLIKGKLGFSFVLFNLFIVWTAIVGFCYINSIKNYHFGLSTISINNSLANVIQSKSYKISDDKEIVNFIDERINRDSSIYKIVFLLNSNISPGKFKGVYPKSMLPLNIETPVKSGYSYTRLKQFINSCFYSKEQLNYTLNRFVRFIGTYKKVSFASLIMLFLTFVRIKNKRDLPVTLVLFFVLIWLNVIMIITWGIEDWERLLLPSFPVIALVYIYLINLILSNIDMVKIEDRVKRFVVSISNSLT
jgi:hypothetical protein